MQYLTVAYYGPVKIQTVYLRTSNCGASLCLESCTNPC